MHRKQIKRALDSVTMIAILLFLVLFLQACSEPGQRVERGPVDGTTVILVRHAEKLDDSEDPALSEEGLERARVLAEMLRAAEISALFASQYQRTQETLRPLANRIGQNLRVVDAGEVESLVEKVRTGFRGKTSVIAGHSDTVPKIIQALGGPDIGSIEEDIYDNLFILTVLTPEEAVLTRLKYGAVSREGDEAAPMEEFHPTLG